MITVRYNLFETNSSSVHALVIPKDQQVLIPKHVKLRSGEYGWEAAEYGDTLSYLYTACKYERSSELPKLLKFLKSLGIEVEEEREDTHRWAYVDHGDQIPFEELFGNEELLTRFLFGTQSYIKTGNDNEDCIYPEETDRVDIIWKFN